MGDAPGGAPPPPPPSSDPSWSGEPGRPAKPPSNLVWGILTTVFCCLPFGIASIVFAARVDGLWQAGQYAEAQEASRKARLFAIVAAGVSAALIVLWLLVSVAIGGAGGF